MTVVRECVSERAIRALSCKDGIDSKRVGWGDHHHRYVPCACEPSSVSCRLPVPIVRSMLFKNKKNGQCPTGQSSHHGPRELTLNRTFPPTFLLYYLLQSLPHLKLVRLMHTYSAVCCRGAAFTACGVRIRRRRRIRLGGFIRRRVRSRGGRRVTYTHMHTKSYEWPGE
jgi:hypothetical protein